jgi:hypothetical protein
LLKSCLINFAVIVLDEPTDFIIPKICGTPCRNTGPNINCQESRTHFVSKTHGSGTEYQYSKHSATSQCDDSHVIKPSQSNSLSGSHMSTSNQSKYMYNENDHMTEVNQSQSSANKHSNVTCGNCGEKGHNRTFSRCPRYHTAEESARREVQYIYIILISYKYVCIKNWGLTNFLNENINSINPILLE